jgi:hypothetical protein
MTAAAAPASEDRQQGGAVPWRRIMRATIRQHRAALRWTAVAVAVLVGVLLATGIPLHLLAASGGPSWYGASRASVDYGGLLQWLALLLQLYALLAGMFLGAPLLPREIADGTARLAWTQAASRTRWLLGQVLPVAGVLVLAALGLGAAWAWWLSPFPHLAIGRGAPWSPWRPTEFNLNPVLLAGWAVFSFALGVVLGAAIRRTLPAMAATLACYCAVLIEVTRSWRMHYLAPLHQAVPVQFQPGGGYSYAVYWGAHQPVIMSEALGWPDGRLLSWWQSQQEPAAWLTRHHIMMWITYQPASRYHVFELIELGWLLAASALLVAAAVFVIRRRRA